MIIDQNFNHIKISVHFSELSFLPYISFVSIFVPKIWITPTVSFSKFVYNMICKKMWKIISFLTDWCSKIHFVKQKKLRYISRKLSTEFSTQWPMFRSGREYMQTSAFILKFYIIWCIITSFLKFQRKRIVTWIV